MRKYTQGELEIVAHWIESLGRTIEDRKKIKVNERTDEIEYNFFDPVQTLSLQRSGPVLYTGVISRDLAEKIISSANYKDGILSSATRAYLIREFQDWAGSEGIDVKGEHEDLLISLNPEVLEKHLRVAKENLYAIITEMRRLYEINDLPTRTEDGFLRLGYATLEQDRNGLRVHVQPYKSFENTSTGKKLIENEKLSSKDIRTAKELTRVDILPTLKTLTQIQSLAKIQLREGNEEVEFLRRRILDQIRDGRILVDEDFTEKLLADQLPSDLRVLNDSLDLSSEVKRISVTEDKRITISSSNQA